MHTPSTNLYLISGLGADETVFAKLKFPVGYNVIFIDWVPTENGETIASYARKMAQAINTTMPFYICGLSFGGILAVEMNSFLAPEKTILLSSMTSNREVMWYYKVAGVVRLPLLLRDAFFNNVDRLSYWFFGMQTKEEKELLKRMLVKADLKFLRWALMEIFFWKNTVRPERLVHIHGTADRVLPIFFVRPDIRVKGSGHLMTFTHADEINKILATIL